ncbi:MAG: 50S ribosomal protein L18 [Elusimicrobia bacterium]|nr:50S ribosomal protein L18 [Elusimicrobiota bacterium]
MNAKARARFFRRQQRVRQWIRGTGERPRLAVFRGQKHIVAQLIDDERGSTLVGVSSLAPELRKELKLGANVAAATRVGALLAQKAQTLGIRQAVLDRRGWQYHGRIRALTDAVRQAGISI